MCIVLITYVQIFLLYLLKFIYTNIFECQLSLIFINIDTEIIKNDIKFTFFISLIVIILFVILFLIIKKLFIMIRDYSLIIENY